MEISHSYVSLPEGNYIDYIHKHTHKKRIDNRVCLKTGSLQTAIARSIQNGKCALVWRGDKSWPVVFFWQILPIAGKYRCFMMFLLWESCPLSIFKGGKPIVLRPVGHFWMQPSGHKTRMRWIHNWQIWLFNLKNVHTFCASIGAFFRAILNNWLDVNSS
jgi:hypothetical protein